jgi:hypothetical protein
MGARLLPRSSSLYYRKIITMEIHMQLINPNTCLIGFSYDKGEGLVNEKQVVFHEVGFGFFFGAMYLIFYKKKRGDE